MTQKIESVYEMAREEEFVKIASQTDRQTERLREPLKLIILVFVLISKVGNVMLRHCEEVDVLGRGDER